MFHNFGQLPSEIRLTIYEMALPERVIEIQIKPEAYTSSSDTTFFEDILHLEASLENNDLNANYARDRNFFISRPVIPSLFHVSREARSSCIDSYYSPCQGQAFRSRRQFPYSLSNPKKDILWVAQSLNTILAMETEYMFSASAAEALGSPRPFVLDLLACDGGKDIANVRQVAIAWTDMHLETLRPQLLKSLKKWKSLRRLYLVFSEQRDDNLELRMMGSMRGKVVCHLVGEDEATVRGRYGQRQLMHYGLLAAKLNVEIEEEEKRVWEEERRKWNGPRVEVRLSQYLKIGVTV